MKTLRSDWPLGFRMRISATVSAMQMLTGAAMPVTYTAFRHAGGKAVTDTCIQRVVMVRWLVTSSPSTSRILVSIRGVRHLPPSGSVHALAAWSRRSHQHRPCAITKFYLYIPAQTSPLKGLSGLPNTCRSDGVDASALLSIVTSFREL